MPTTLGNIYELRAYFDKNNDAYVTLIIDGEVKTYHDIIQDLFPPTIMNCNAAKRRRYEAHNTTLVELEYINFIYKKQMFNRNYAKNIDRMHKNMKHLI